MREIKFMAWYPQKEKMYEVAKMDIGGDPDQSTCDLVCIDEELFDVYINEVEIRQFTGLYNKNGKEIYEDDIFKYSSEYDAVFGIVKFGEIEDRSNGIKHIGFYIEWQNDGMNEWCKWWRNDIAYWANDQRTEIVGNIHDNPELLPEKSMPDEYNFEVGM